MGESKQAPLVALQPSGQATILSYNVPEPNAYPGRNYIDLPFDESYFASDLAEPPDRIDPADLAIDDLVDVVKGAVLTGFLDPKVFPLAQGGLTAVAGASRTPSAAPQVRTLGAPPASAKRPARRRPGSAGKLVDQDTGEAVEPEIPEDDKPGQSGSGGGGDKPSDDDGAVAIATHLQAGYNIAVYTNVFGTQVSTYVPAPTVAEPRLMLVEEYRLSTYPAAFGAGRVVQTMTLLPGEKTTISVSTYTKSTTTAAEASSILDSVSEEAAISFDSAVQAEQSDQSTYAKSFEYNAEAEASASWGFGSVSVSGGVAGSTNSSREEFAKNVSSATEKQSTSASSKRDIQVNTSFEVSTEVGEETSITREIANINLSAPLNFVFRQMNQEFITFLHLVDVRVAFFNNFVESRRERTLPELDALLDEVMVNDEAKKNEVRAEIIHSLTNMADWRGELVRNAVRRQGYPERDGSLTQVWQFNRELVTEYTDPTTGVSFTVPGVVMSVRKNVMRTEGLMVEAVLGLAPSLDAYNGALQDEALRERQIANEAALLSNRREQLAQQVVGSGSANQVEAFATVFAPAGAPAPTPTPNGSTAPAPA